MIWRAAVEITADHLKYAFLDNADDISARFGELDMNMSDALRNIRNGWGLFVSEMDSTIGISRIVSRTIVNGFNQVLFMLRRGQDAFMRLADRVGGVNNLMRLLLLSAGAIFAALNAGKILNFIRSVSRGLSKINLKILAIIAIFIILALIIDDFIAFMRGDDSLLGSLLEKAGIDAEAVRQTIIRAWEAIRNFLSATWAFIQNLGRSIWGGLKRFWDKHSEGIKAAIIAAWEAIKTMLNRINRNASD